MHNMLAVVEKNGMMQEVDSTITSEGISQPAGVRRLTARQGFLTTAVASTALELCRLKLPLQVLTRGMLAEQQCD